MYYLPVWFQAIEGSSAVQSGIHLLPMLLALVVSTISNGFMVSKTGYYTPSLIFGICLNAIGAGLLTTLQVDSPPARWIGYQILYGFGLGCANQAPNMAAQTVLPRRDVAIGASLMFFAQQLFGAVFTSVGQNVLDTQLASRFAKIPGIGPGVASPEAIQSTGATSLLGLVRPGQHAAALRAYNGSLRADFQVGAVVACLAILGAVTMEWRSVRDKKAEEQKSNPDGAAERGKAVDADDEKSAEEQQPEAGHQTTMMPATAAEEEAAQHQGEVKEQ